MEITFYIWGLVALFYYFTTIVSPIKSHLAYMNLRKLGDDKVKFKKWPSEKQTKVVLLMLYTGWGFLGLLSSQWLCFAGILLISTFPIKRWTIGYFLTNVLCFCLILFLLINKYHLHINLLDLAKSYL